MINLFENKSNFYTSTYFKVVCHSNHDFSNENIEILELENEKRQKETNGFDAKIDEKQNWIAENL